MPIHIGTCFRFYTQMLYIQAIVLDFIRKCRWKKNKAFAYRIYSHFTQQCISQNCFCLPMGELCNYSQHSTFDGEILSFHQQVTFQCLLQVIQCPPRKEKYLNFPLFFHLTGGFHLCLLVCIPIRLAVQFQIHHFQMTSSEGFQQHFSIISNFVCCGFYMKNNVAFTLISFAVLK